ncbi:hypothetical protein FG379_000450 [Cryptosporidium bovis]|uniref:uncharacterized protein n=1 Tax=Cryptosporidium bovis TaxID=310047 RepID=UPI00351A62E8|nr:hypothetical protein FG379_000450 [Cryptosporidium bovis]
MSDSDNIESVINTEHTATEAPNLSEIHTSQYSNPPIQISPSMNSVNVINTDNGEIVNTSSNSNIVEDGNVMEASNNHVENAVPNNNLNNTVLGDQNNVTQKNVSAMNDTTSVMPINHNFSRATEASAATSKSNVSGIGNAALNVSTMGGNANINPVGGYNGIQLDSSQNLQQIQANNIGSINVTQPTGADLINQHQILILNALQQQHLQMQKPKVQQNDSSSQNQNIQNNQLQAQLLNSLVSHQPQMNQLMFHNPILFNALHSGNNNPIGIPPLPPHPGHSSIGLQPFPVHPLLLPAVLHAQQQQQKQQTSQETQQLINSPHNPTIQATQIETSADDNPASKVATISEAGNNGINLNSKMTNSPKVEIQTTNITSENITNKAEPAKNIDLANSSPNMNPRDSSGLKMPSPSLIHNINQLPPTILPLPQPHQGMRFPQPGITGQNNLINPFFMLQRMVSPNSLYMGFNPQLGMTANNSSNNNNTSNGAGNSSVSNGNNASGSATVAAQPGILPNSGHVQIPNIPLLPPQGLLAAAAGIPSQQIPQVLNFINNGGGIMNNGEFFGQNILGGIANLSGIGGNFLMENDLERLHNHAESLVKTLLETSVPKAGVKLRLEWDKKRYCFKFTVYQVEEVTDSLGFQKKRMIPIDQDELFVNVNASKQLNIENIEKAMWSAFVSVRHTLAKYCDRQAGQRRQTSTSVSTTGATSLSRGLVQNNLTKMEDNNNSMIIGGGTGGKIKGYKKDELNINNLLDKKYLQGATNGNLISLNLAGAINGKSSYKADPYNTGNSPGVGSATVHGNANIGGNGRGKRGYAGTTTRSGRFVSLKYGYDDLMLSDDEGTMGGEQEYVGRKGRKPKYGNVNIAVGGGSSSGEDNNINGVISNNISSTNNRYAKTYITNRGRRGSGHSSNSNSGLGIYKTRGSGLSSDIYNNHDSITVATSNAPIFVLQKDEPGKKHSLVGLYAEWVDKHTIWDPRKGPLKTVFVSESFSKEDFNNDKRDILRFTTNNYIKWDPSHIITDLRSIHIPISMAGEYFGLLRKERTSNNDDESNNEGYLVKNNSDSVDEIDCDNKTNNNNDSENHNNKNVKESNTVTPITIKGNNVPNANQIRFVSNNEKYRNLLSSFNNSNDNMSSMGSDANEKYLEEKLFELETVDSVLVSTIQTTAALEQRKKKENKNSLATTIPTGSFLTSVFSHNHSNNNYNSDSTNEEDNLIGGNDRITINSNMYNSDDHLININNEEIQEYKHLILRFMHQQNGDDDFTLENNNNNSMLIDSNTENKDNTSQSFDSNNNVNSISKNGNRLASRGLKRRGTMRNGSIVDNDQIHNLNNLQSSSSNNQSAFNNDDNTEIRNNHPNALNSISNSSYSSNNYNQVPNGLTVTGTSEEGINFNSGMFGSGAIAASAMLESLITSVRGNSSDKYRQQQMLQAYPQNRFVSKKKCKETNEILAKYVNDLANEYCNRNFGSSNLADGYVNAFNSHVLKNCNKQ